MTNSASPRRLAISIRDEVDVYASRSRVRSLAFSLGFSPKAIGELVIVVSELAWNILKHAQKGLIELAAVDDAESGVGVCIMARDSGPPFHDFGIALLDGHNDRGPIDPMELLGRRGIGGGLGAVTRLTDRVTYAEDDAGKCVTALRFRSKR